LIGYLTRRVYFISLAICQNKADIDALLLKYEEFLMGNPENKKYLRDLSKGNQRK
jgi:ABC-2 type transport system ATP-binding protein